MKLTVLSFLLSLAMATSLFAQQSIKIIDERSNPVEFALVNYYPSSEHIHSDAQGNFLIPQNAQVDSISIQHLGYERVAITAADLSKTSVIKLKPSIFLMETVAVNATDPLHSMSAVDVQTRPVANSQELLRNVPGVFIAQHAGGGKAEQIFLRGFDIDHGTDLAIAVEGMPVNMVSHAHGQGYADMHFIIPEAIAGIDYGKGPYDADKGNFATAGHVDFRLNDRLEQSFVQLEGGSFDYGRLSAGIQLLEGPQENLYLLGESLRNDGPFVSPQGLQRTNVMARYGKTLRNGQQVKLTATHFSSRWDASGQVPQRAIDQGFIGRFGAIDDTEGGETSRTNVMLSHNAKLTPTAQLKTDIYASRYDFELFSNFTFFLENQDEGDQIRQAEQRVLYGFNSEYQQSLGRLGSSLFRAGVGLRSDRVTDNSLQSTANRNELLENLALGQVFEDNYYAYGSLEWQMGKWTVTPGLRADAFNFNYEDELTTQYDVLRDNTVRLSPKLSTSYQASPQVAVYAKVGRGFHSNDSRAVVANEVQLMVPAAYGADLGTAIKLGDRTLLNTAAWILDLQQEFVYVGDAGIVEPSGKTRRMGFDVSLRSQLTRQLFLDGDYTYSHARSREDEEGENLIPLAPIHTFTGGLTFKQSAWIAGLRARVLGDRPANEDYSLTADGYALVDGNVSYQVGRITISARAENILNTEWNEAQFATESRLQGEAASVEEIHFTPGTPRRYVVGVKFGF